MPDGFGERRRRGRRVRALLAGLSLLAALGGCQRGAETPRAAPDRVLNLYSWAQYFPPEVLRQFESETGIHVNYSVLDSNDVAETTLAAGHSGFDLVTVNASPHLGRQIPKGLWQPLDLRLLPNRANADPQILALMRQVDPGNRYAIPYMWGTIGLIYNVDRIHALMPDAPLDSLDMVLRPELASRFAGCGISVLETWVDMLPLLSRYVGQSDLSASPAALRPIADTFAAVHPYLRRITTTGYYDQVARGELCLAIGFSADAMVARRSAAEFGNGVHIEYRQPRETVPMYVDAFAIPADARNVAAAHRFIDFALRPDVAVRLATATGFSIANTAAVAMLDPALRDNPIVYPPPRVRDRLTLGRGYTMAETREYTRTWLRMKTGH